MRNQRGTADKVPGLLTQVEVAERFRVTRGTISRWTSSGVLPAVRVRGTLRYREVDIAEIIGAREAEG